MPGLDLQGALDHIGQQWRQLTRWRAAARAMAGSAAVLGAAAVASWILPANPAAEFALWSLAGGLAVVWSAIALLPLRHRPTRAEVARLVEERCPELEDRLAAATDSLETRSPSPFAALLVADAASRVGAIPLDRIFEPDVCRRARLTAAAAAAAVLMATAVALPGLSRTASDLSAWLFPPTLEVRVLPGDVKIAAGKPLTIVAELHSSDGRRRLAAPELAWEGAGKAEKAAMTAGGEADRYVYTFESVTDAFTYTVAAGAQRSPRYAVQVLHAPRVDRIDVHYTFPPFTGLGPRTETNAGDIYAPAGTRVRIEVHADKPVVEGSLALADGEPLNLTVRSDGVLAGDLRIDRDNAYRVALKDADGLTAPGETEYFIRTMTDRPPEVRVMRPAGDRQATPLEEVSIEARADDDYGVQSLDLVYAVGAGPQKAVPLARPGGATNVEGKATVFLEDLKVQPGDFVSYFARARDVPRGKSASETQSDIFFIEVKAFGSEFQAAQSQAVGGGSGPLGSLAAAQKEILIATWKLQRRSSAGRSAKDIKDVAKAQHELRTRAQQVAPLADPARARRMGQPGAADAASPISKAIESMQRAAAALDNLQLADAVPHEMEALNQLLKAEAQQQRRVQVARNQGAGGGGSNRMAPDLSALFDRELQRQQETNYETRSSTEERQETAESDALAKVRELAKRQEEINREQRALAAQGLSAEEMKRRLERLTREQSELRQRAEELAQQMAREESGRRGGEKGRQGGAESKSQSGQGRGSDGQSALRDASQAMGSSASDMRRQNAAGASASGERAAERLRELERQMQREQPGSAKKALGNAMLEAQQVAEAQRRIADETQRAAAAGGPAGSDDARRLAGEKDRLADRVDALERTLQTLSGRSDGSDKQRLTEAARTLDKEQVARRMRDGASTLREDPAGKASSTDGKAGVGTEAGGRQGRMAETDRALARALDQVAEQLGGTGQSADARRMSEQLARAQDARERLAAIERQIDALAKQGAEQQGKEKQTPSKGEQAGAPAGKAGAEQTGSHGPGQKQAASQQGKDGQGGQGGNMGGELARLQEEYRRELQKTEELMRQVQGQAAGMGGTPEHHEFSRSAPGTEAFKQDYSRWDSLRKDVNLAIEKLQASLSTKLSEQQTRDRVNAGADDRVPEEYRALIAKYYQSLAATGKKP